MSQHEPQQTFKSGNEEGNIVLNTIMTEGEERIFEALEDKVSNLALLKKYGECPSNDHEGIEFLLRKCLEEKTAIMFSPSPDKKGLYCVFKTDYGENPLLIGMKETDNKPEQQKDLNLTSFKLKLNLKENSKDMFKGSTYILIPSVSGESYLLRVPFVGEYGKGGMVLDICSKFNEALGDIGAAH